MKVEIEVTQADIDHGIPDDIRDCPVARATGRALGISSDSVRVEDDFIAIEVEPPNGFGEGDCPIPDEVVEFIAAFDCHEPVQPFRFILDSDA